jgi:hypothetical protein
LKELVEDQFKAGLLVIWTGKSAQFSGRGRQFSPNVPQRARSPTWVEWVVKSQRVETALIIDSARGGFI